MYLGIWAAHRALFLNERCILIGIYMSGKRRQIMNKFFRVGLGIAVGVAAGVAVFEIIRRRRTAFEARPPFAEAAENGED
jgi:hypothetical protein